MALEGEAVNWGCLNVVAKLIPDATCQQRPRDQPIQLMNIYEKCSTDGGGGGDAHAGHSSTADEFEFNAMFT